MDLWPSHTRTAAMLSGSEAGCGCMPVRFDLAERGQEFKPAWATRDQVSKITNYNNKHAVETSLDMVHQRLKLTTLQVLMAAAWS